MNFSWLLLGLTFIQSLWGADSFVAPDEQSIRDEARRVFFDVTLKKPVIELTSGQQLADVRNSVENISAENEYENYPVGRTVYVIADLHGDFLAAISILYAGGLIDRNGGWTGGDSIIVQLGDIADRGPDSPAIYELFWRLGSEARQAGGNILHLLGNHEVMNLMGQTHYISTREMRRYYEGSHKKAIEIWNPITGPLGQSVMETFKTTHRIGDLLFVHAGLLPKYAAKSQGGSLKFLDENMKSAILAFAKGDISQYQSLKEVLEGDTSPIWTRELTHEKSLKSRCKLVAAALNKTKLTRQFVGHTPTKSRRVESYCNNTFVQTDTGNSRWMYDSQTMIRIQTTPKREEVWKEVDTSISLSASTTEDDAAESKKSKGEMRLYERTFDELYITSLPIQDAKNKTQYKALTVQWNTLFADEVCILSDSKQVPCQPTHFAKNDEL